MLEKSHLVHCHCERIYIARVPQSVSAEQFRGHPIRTFQQCSCFGSGRANVYISLGSCEPKVAKECSFAFVDKHIDGFEVTMHYPLRVKVCNSESDLLNLMVNVLRISR